MLAIAGILFCKRGGMTYFRIIDKIIDKNR